MLDWDRVRVFHAVAEAGSFTRAAESLGLSQSAVSRQISALEDDIGTPLFHRHARGLVRTETGDILLATARDVAARMAVVETTLSETRNQPVGDLRINTTVGFGTIFLTPLLVDFYAQYPDIAVQLLLTDHELDLAMREADIGIRFNPPTQPDLIQKRLYTVHTHVYAAPSYLDTYGEPQSLEELSEHRLIVYGDVGIVPPVPSLNWILRDPNGSGTIRRAALRVNSVVGMLRAAEAGVGIATLPDYLAANSPHLKRILPQRAGPSSDAFFVYPEELRQSKRVAVFRDFLLAKMAQQKVW